ncbi:hypothetical protein BU26DRAFT_511495 [Trematosphaeria pertusa]|uniref:Uncharacterized protein n=1 Tax=Trematosphaeria pertusa TaxID=390896 RepID=A0A6A6HTR1_9PLEO|nr:uncharacterized protein BU26DRAFT_511495 [Trematosphaeria pertusa]KAF2241401.1 hypothetical protein BU26DRAFT_511495 [Trematosphaeria pertusa]
MKLDIVGNQSPISNDITDRVIEIEAIMCTRPFLVHADIDVVWDPQSPDLIATSRRRRRRGDAECVAFARWHNDEPELDRRHCQVHERRMSIHGGEPINTNEVTEGSDRIDEILIILRSIIMTIESLDRTVSMINTTLHEQEYKHTHAEELGQNPDSNALRMGSSPAFRILIADTNREYVGARAHLLQVCDRLHHEAGAAYKRR